MHTRAGMARRARRATASRTRHQSQYISNVVCTRRLVVGRAVVPDEGRAGDEHGGARREERDGRALELAVEQQAPRAGDDDRALARARTRRGRGAPGG